jgi:hypothetical protein
MTVGPNSTGLPTNRVTTQANGLQIEFTSTHSYGSEREGISVPVVLKAGENSVRLAANIDNGATFCLFRNELAEALGLDPANSTLKRFRTANSFQPCTSSQMRQ